jgi:hypothetical protein
LSRHFLFLKPLNNSLSTVEGNNREKSQLQQKKGPKCIVEALEKNGKRPTLNEIVDRLKLAPFVSR